MAENLDGKKYLRDQSKNGLYIAMVIFGILGFLVSLFLTVRISAVGIVAVTGAIQLAVKDKPILRFYEKYLEYKPAPLASVVLIKYGDVTSVENAGKTINIHVKGQNKPVKVPLNLFNESDRSKVAAHMEQLAVEA